MTAKPPLTRRQAVATLKRYGIEGRDVYLIDIIPLIEMIWADGKVQEGEIAVLKDFLQKHVARINAMAGYPLLDMAQAQRFAASFLKRRPDAALLHALRELVAPVRLAAADERLRENVKESLLAACLDIAASSVTVYPYGLHERFDTQEKRCFFEILDEFENYQPPPGD